MNKLPKSILDIAFRLSATRWGRALCIPLLRRCEALEIVDAEGCVCGIASRKQVHGDNRLLHRVVHVLVFDSNDRLLLQKRSMQKRVAPGRWDTSVGGHVDFGETVETALHREIKEELGICPISPAFAYCYTHTNDFESERVFTYVCRWEAGIRYNTAEISEVRFWDHEEILAAMGTGRLSENFEDEFRRYQQWKAQTAPNSRKC